MTHNYGYVEYIIDDAVERLKDVIETNNSERQYPEDIIHKIETAIATLKKGADMVHVIDSLLNKRCDISMFRQWWYSIDSN